MGEEPSFLPGAAGEGDRPLLQRGVEGNATSAPPAAFSLHHSPEEANGPLPIFDGEE